MARVLGLIVVVAVGGWALVVWGGWGDPTREPDLAGPGADLPAREKIADLPSAVQEPERLELTSEDVAVEETPLGAPREAPLPTAAEMFQRFPSLAEATFVGAMDPELILSTALGALALVGDREADVTTEDLAIYEVYDLGGLAFSLTVPLDPTSSASDMTLESRFTSPPGWLTGCVDDGASSSSFELHVNVDAETGTAAFGGHAKSELHHTAGLASFIESVDRPVPEAGVFLWKADGTASWQQITIDCSPSDDGLAGWTSSLGALQPISVEPAERERARKGELARSIASLQELSRSLWRRASMSGLVRMTIA